VASLSLDQLLKRDFIDQKRNLKSTISGAATEFKPLKRLEKKELDFCDNLYCSF